MEVLKDLVEDCVRSIQLGGINVFGVLGDFG